MSWLDFFRNKEKKEEKSVEEIEVSLLSQKIEQEQRGINEKRINIEEMIKRLLDEFILKIKEDRTALKKINLDEKKEGERVKFIVKENLNVYLEHLNRLIENLEKIESKDYLIKFAGIIESFKANSVHSLDKVTILIGKEIDSIKKTLKNGSDSFKEIVYDNKGLFDKEKNIDILKNLLKELEKRKTFENEIKILAVSIEKSKKELEVKKSEAEKRINEIKEGQEYIIAIETKEKEIEELRKNEEELFKIKTKIDLKFLGNQFHSDKKKVVIISELSRDFILSLENNKNNIILFLKESLPGFDINNLAGTIEKREEMKKSGELEILEEIKNRENEIKKYGQEISRIEDLEKNEKGRYERILEKINRDKKEINSVCQLIWPDLVIKY